MARYDTVDVNGSEMRICIAAPEGPGPHPGMVLMCHIGGLDEFTEDRIDRLAAAGFVAAAPDKFHYHDWIEDRNQRRATLRDKKLLDDINAAVDHMAAVEKVASGRIGIMGHCMGGRTALLGAGGTDRFCAAVFYYGGRTMISWGDDGPTPFELIPNIKGPVMGFYGNLDKEPAPADVDKIEAELKKHAIPTEFHRYDGADHAFQNFMNPDRYHEAAATDS